MTESAARTAPAPRPSRRRRRPSCPAQARQRLGDRAGAGGERLELERAHRAVPEDRRRRRDLCGVARPRCAGRCRDPSSPRARRCRRTIRVAARRRRSGRRARGPAAARAGSRSRSAARSTRRASSTPSSSTSESPVSFPCARKKLKHIAPPIRIASAISRKRSITPILSLTLAPPEHHHERPRRVRQQRASARSPRARAGGRRRAGSRCATPSVVACARCAAPKASFDVDVGQPRQSRGQLGVVPGLPRLEAAVLQHQHLAAPAQRPCSSTCGPDHRRRLAHAGAGQLGQARATRAPSRRPDRGPSGRSRCETSTSRRAALAQIVERRQRGPDPGVVAHRRSSAASSSGTLKSTRTSTRAPSTVELA